MEEEKVYCSDCGKTAEISYTDGEIEYCPFCGAELSLQEIDEEFDEDLTDWLEED